MEVELFAQAKDKPINRLAALIVLSFSVATGLGDSDRRAGIHPPMFRPL